MGKDRWRLSLTWSYSCRWLHDRDKGLTGGNWLLNLRAVVRYTWSYCGVVKVNRQLLLIFNIIKRATARKLKHEHGLYPNAHTNPQIGGELTGLEIYTISTENMIYFGRLPPSRKPQHSADQIKTRETTKIYWVERKKKAQSPIIRQTQE